MIERDYDRSAVFNYAKKWAFGRNPDYYSFNKLGGDCTNFASQCIYAGAKVMNFTPRIRLVLHRFAGQDGVVDGSGIFV